MEAGSSASASGLKSLRGWCGVGMTEAIGRLAMIGFPDFRYVQVEGGLEPLGDHAAVAPVGAVKRRLLPTKQDRLGTDGERVERGRDTGRVKLPKLVEIELAVHILGHAVEPRPRSERLINPVAGRRIPRRIARDRDPAWAEEIGRAHV